MAWSLEAGQKDLVAAAITQAVAAVEQDSPVVQAAMRAVLQPESESARQALRRKFLADLRAASAALAAEKTPQPGEWFSAHTPMVGLVQSSMTAAAELAEEANQEAPRFEPYGTMDPRWAECLFDAWKTSFSGIAPFVQHQSLSDFLAPIPDSCRVALMADWGGSNQAAENVGVQIHAASPDLVIHLGDIYYAGQKNESDKFLARWPLTGPDGAIAPGTSYALNGNHEMFSGAHSYFNVVLPKFGQKASYFGLRTTYWQVLAFDSSYVDHRLLDPQEAALTEGAARVGSQWNWLVDKLRNAQGRQTILLSHHQPLSAFEDAQSASANLRQDAAKLFAAAAVPAVFGWFFGHEHRCTIYQNSAAPFRARLIGNGCIPHNAPEPGRQADPGCAAVQTMNSAAWPNGEAKSGFALLRIDGLRIAIEYLNEDGTLFFKETWLARGPQTKAE